MVLQYVNFVFYLGVKLMKSMGWKPGKGVGLRQLTMGARKEAQMKITKINHS